MRIHAEQEQVQCYLKLQYATFFNRSMLHNLSQCEEVLSKPSVTQAHRTAWQQCKASYGF